MTLDYRGKALITVALDPATVERTHVLRRRFGYKIQSIIETALGDYLTRLETAVLPPLTHPGKFKCGPRGMRGRRTAAPQGGGKSLFGSLVKAG